AMDGQKPLVQLFVRQSVYDPDANGYCPFCQKWFMLLHLLMEKGYLSFKLTPVNLAIPLPSYEQLNVGRRLPVLTVSDDWENAPIIVVDTDEEIESLFIKWNIDQSLVSVSSVDSMCKHCLFTHGFGLKTGDRFIKGEEPCYSDCNLGPKLHHVRIAGEFYRNYSIPNEFYYIWTYLANVYQLDSFKMSCPSDKDILVHLLDKVTPASSCELNEIQAKIMMMPDAMKTLTLPPNVEPKVLPPFTSILDTTKSHPTC
ncbi:Chloride intracellular channel, partial [Cichlidogyrus casuarinus]